MLPCGEMGVESWHGAAVLTLPAIYKCTQQGPCLCASSMLSITKLAQACVGMCENIRWHRGQNACMPGGAFIGFQPCVRNRCPPLDWSSARLRFRAMALEVMPMAGLPGKACSLLVSCTMSRRRVGSPPVSLILFTPADTKTSACTDARRGCVRLQVHDMLLVAARILLEMTCTSALSSQLGRFCSSHKSDSACPGHTAM